MKATKTANRTIIAKCHLGYGQKPAGPAIHTKCSKDPEREIDRIPNNILLPFRILNAPVF